MVSKYQYPYILQISIINPSTKDENGNWSEETESWVNLCRCRDEAGKGKKVTDSDNTIHEYTFLIQKPEGVEPIKKGTKVRVMEGNVKRAEGTVIYSRKDKFHSRTWV
ncbi:hypothetical protein [Albibacterium profundi]|uniref:Uncharacterized protein n=1 Tax=Albibacterium profundi TaxID=3134906 RepID=A0ABV5CF09_9SPHI